MKLTPDVTDCLAELGEMQVSSDCICCVCNVLNIKKLNSFTQHKEQLPSGCKLRRRLRSYSY